MKYCKSIFNKEDIKNIKEYDEIILGRTKLLDTILEDEDNRNVTFIVIMHIHDDNFYSKIMTLKEKNIKYKIFLCYEKRNAEADERISILKESNIDFFLSNMIRTWEDLVWHAELGVSDFIIDGELGFSVLDIKKAYPNINIRVTPQFASTIQELPCNLKSFFIRPEDIDLYEGTIDILDFHDEKPDTYLNIYKDSKKWFGYLNEIISNLDTTIDNRRIHPSFGSARLKCNKKCIKGSKCSICDRVVELEEVLSQTDLFFKKIDN